MKYLIIGFIALFSSLGFSADTPFDSLIGEFKNSTMAQKSLNPMLRTGVCFAKEEPAFSMPAILFGLYVSDAGPAFGKQDYRFGVYLPYDQHLFNSYNDYISTLTRDLITRFTTTRYLGGSAVSPKKLIPNIARSGTIYLRYNDRLVPQNRTEIVLITGNDSRGVSEIKHACYFFKN